MLPRTVVARSQNLGLCKKLGCRRALLCSRIRLGCVRNVSHKNQPLDCSVTQQMCRIFNWVFQICSRSQDYILFSTSKPMYRLWKRLRNGLNGQWSVFDFCSCEHSAGQIAICRLFIRLHAKDFNLFRFIFTHSDVPFLKNAQKATKVPNAVASHLTEASRRSIWDYCGSAPAADQMYRVH